MLGTFFSYKGTKDEGEKKYKKKKEKKKKNNYRREIMSIKRWMSSLMRSHNILKTYSLSPSMLGENHIDVCLLGSSDM